MPPPHRTRLGLSCTFVFATTLATGSPALAQSSGNRLLGLDVSAWQGDISQPTWNNLQTVEGRSFAFLRATRGGTTGEDHRQGGGPHRVPALHRDTLLTGTPSWGDPGASLGHATASRWASRRPSIP